MARILRVFPKQISMTPRDNYAFVGDPPHEFCRPEADVVHVSCTMTWDKPFAEHLKLAWQQYYTKVEIGGPAYNDPSDGFVPGLYIRHGITFTSRGCNNQCPWCEAWKREGKLRELPVIYSGNIIQDNNLLQCSKSHIEKVFVMLKTQKAIEFSGGLDSRSVTDDIADSLRALRIKQVFLACDTKEAIRPLGKAIKKLSLLHQKVRCYVLLKFNPLETISEATDRMINIWEAGAMPFAQLYQPPNKWIEYPIEWKQFARTWSRPAAIKAITSNHKEAK